MNEEAKKLLMGHLTTPEAKKITTMEKVLTGLGLTMG